MLQDETPPSQARNRLVKRSASTRSIASSAALSSGSKIPVPNFRRPATSHQRSATLQEQSMPIAENEAEPGHDRNDSTQWRHYFTPKVADTPTSFLRRASTGIPNPIRRIYPDRRYVPTLVSAEHSVGRAELETDGALNFDFDFGAGTPSFGAATTTSAPSEPRRSFSIGDLLSTGPSPLWKRPKPSKSRLPHGKPARTNTRRVVSAPQHTMGSALSTSRVESDRPVKRREVGTSTVSSPSLYAASSATRASEATAPQEIQLNLGAEALTSPAASPYMHGTSPNPSLSSPLAQRRLPSANETSAAQRPPRLSAATSEITTASSDNESKSIGDASTDYQSDNFFDSFPTRTTQSSGGKRGPPIETIFDESPPNFLSGRSTKLKDFLNSSQARAAEAGDPHRYSTIEEEESISTPRRSMNEKRLASSPHLSAVAYNVFSSSPPAVHEVADVEEIDWDVPENYTSSPVVAADQPNTLDRAQEEFYPTQRSLPFRLGPLTRPQNSSSVTSTLQRNGTTDRTTTIFDWSEAQPSPSQNHTPPRPKTVHGKKDPENRGSRQQGRRAPSAMHARSHSVPVVPDVDGKRSNATANKFGTWGVGSKAVTEDWNEDFDFEEDLPELMGAAELEEKRVDSGHEMFVPKSIREQQNNVVANIGLLREWGLLIEELKELRVRAVALEMLTGRHAQAWSEVDAMIALADQESEEDTLEPRRSPPSSPGFDYDAFDEPVREAVQTVRARTQSIRAASPALASNGNASSGLSFDEPSTPLQALLARPRKDSEAVARSVIEALQYRRSVSDPTALQPVQSKKVPFDTGTLRHIVPYVNKLKRQVKEAMREKEGLYTSPRRRSGIETEDDMFDDDDVDDDDGPFGRIFYDPAGRQSRRAEAATDDDEPFG
nr:hypothetical protein B0A51_14457 [Rachicladosporium sp. CCFEE 5018]